MAMLIDIVSGIFIALGGFLCLLGAAGVLRMPDVFSRMHAAGMVDTGGAISILIGLMFQAGFTIVTVKLALIVAFLFFTSPTTTHALAAAALDSGLKPQADDYEGSKHLDGKGKEPSKP